MRTSLLPFERTPEHASRRPRNAHTSGIIINNTDRMSIENQKNA